MLKIRLKKTGRKRKPFYKIVVMENLSRRDGKAIEILGYYNPINKDFSCNKFLLHRYLNVGARPTNTMRHLIKRITIIK